MEENTSKKKGKVREGRERKLEKRRERGRKERRRGRGRGKSTSSVQSNDPCAMWFVSGDPFPACDNRWTGRTVPGGWMHTQTQKQTNRGRQTDRCRWTVMDVQVTDQSFQ